MTDTMQLPQTSPQIVARHTDGFLMGKLYPWPIYLPMRYVGADTQLSFGGKWLTYRWTGRQYEQVAA